MGVAKSVGDRPLDGKINKKWQFNVYVSDKSLAEFQLNPNFES
jgi:hypothetical protein